MKFNSSYFLSIPLALTLALSVGCGQDGADDLPPPETPEPAAPQAVEPEPPLPAEDSARAQPTSEWPPLHLQQVIPAERAAVIDGEVVYEGDQFDGITLREVEVAGVILQRGTDIVFLARGAVLEPDPEEEITGAADEITHREGDITGEE